MELLRLRIWTLSRVLMLVIFLQSAVVSAQNTLQVTYPPAQPGDNIKDLVPQQYVRFTWISTWPNTSVYIFQGPNDLGHTAYNKLEGKKPSLPSLSNRTTLSPHTDGVGPSITEHAWSAHKLTKNMSRDDPFWLYLYNTNNKSCENCVSNSTRFYIRDKPTDNALKIGLGVGLGVGIPLVAAIAGLSTWLCIRRKRKSQQHESKSGMLLQDTPLSANGQPFSPAPGSGSTAPTMGYGSSMEKRSPIESDGRDVVELPPNSVQVPVEAPVTRERVELEGDYVDERDVKDAAQGRPF